MGEGKNLNINNTAFWKGICNFNELIKYTYYKDQKLHDTHKY